MRLVATLLLLVCMAGVVACKAPRRQSEEMAREDNAPERRPQDKLFIDFQKNWRELISQSPELALPVVRPEQPSTTPQFDPIIISECVFSVDAGTVVPQVTLSWNESATAPGPDVVLLARLEQQPPPPPAARLRFDLAIHQNGLGRNYFTTVLADQQRQRFQLPSNSALINDQAAVTLGGPGLFPKLMDFRVEALRERETDRAFEKHTLVVRDFNQGVTHTVTVDRPGANQWNEARRFVFLTPICPNSF